ncbi:MAG: hypothetical protein ABEJ77_07350 [Halanaeroarchaeum sp.]
MTDDELVVLWTSGDPEVAENMVFMYTLNAANNDWWDDVTLLIWGASTGLLAGDHELAPWFEQFTDAGVTLEACKACAENYDAVADLESLGVEVFYVGERLTEYLKAPSVTVLPV